jgi:type II secretory pathway pseudopilin PulG
MSMVEVVVVLVVLALIAYGLWWVVSRFSRG